LFNLFVMPKSPSSQIQYISMTQITTCAQKTRFMKVLLFIFSLAAFNSSAQDIRFDLFVNGEKCNQGDTCFISRSEENLFTIEGEGCDKFILSGSGAMISRTEEGWIVKPLKRRDEAEFRVSCTKENGMSISLGTYLFNVILEDTPLIEE
jgi:hypothetical protein